MRGGSIRLLGLLALLQWIGVAEAAPRLAISPLGYQITQLQAVPGDPRVFDVTSRAGVVNLGDPAVAVRATLTSSSPYFIVLDGEVSFGNVPRTLLLRPAISQDTFKLRVLLPPRHDPRQLLAFISDLHRALAWNVSCANCGGTNRPPVANAGADQTVFVSQLVTLDGSASSDPDGQALSYMWSFVSRPAGSHATLSSAAAVKPTFVPDREGDYTLQLVVSDGELSSAPDTVQVSTLNSPPVANAGPDQSAVVGQKLALDGSASTDIDGDPLTYGWTVASAPAGSQATIVDPAKVMASFTPDVPGTYLIELVVDDGTVSSAPDSMSITTTQQNTAPVANAGTDQSVHVGETAQLDGSASSDADGDSLSYHWALNSRPGSSNASLQGQTTANPSLTIDRPGTYVAQLIVNDSKVDSAPDTVAISTLNSAPTAHIDASATVSRNATVSLDGSGSSDPDGDALGFTWSILSKPDGSQSILSDANAMQSTFKADRPGVYVIQLVVNDGHVNSAPASASVTATNHAPVANADSAATSQDTAVDVDVLANDTDGDGDTLTIGSVAQPAHGSATIQGNAIRYTPPAGYAGPDSFTYAATDGVDSATATVSLLVTAANRAPTANAGLDQVAYVGDTVALSGAGSSDPDGDVLTYSWSITGGPTNGASLAAAGSVAPTFTASSAGTYVVQLTVNDGRGGSNADSLQVTVAALPTLSIGDVSIAEGNSGSTLATFTVSLSAAIDRQVTVHYATADGTAIAPDDYQAASSTLTFAAGSSTTQQVAVAIVGDTAAEPDESFTLTLSSAVNATLAQATGHAIIINDDAASSQLRLFLANARITPGNHTGIAVILDAPAPAGGLTVSLQSSDETVVQVPASTTVPEGESDVWFTASNFGKAGSAIVSAHGTSGNAQATLVVTEETSALLIDRALSAGEITAEQAYVYRVFAAFGWPGLPTRFRGAQSGRGADPHGKLLIDLKTRFATLSPTAQEQIAPLLVPPIYEGSWGDPAVLDAVAQTADIPALAGKVTHSARLLAAPTGQVLCSEGSRPQRLPVWTSYEVGGLFRIWYLSDPLPYVTHLGTPARTKRLADVALANVMTAYNALHGVFTRNLIDDTDAAICNGGDGLYDIYMYGLADTTNLGEEFDYPGFGTPSPSWIALNPVADWGAGDGLIKATLAHELFHAIDSLYHKDDHDEAYWRMEAMATWAENLAFPGGNFEWVYADEFFSLRDNTLQDVEALLPINYLTQTPSDRTQGDIDSSNAESGYRKYLFFLFLEKKYGAAVLQDILVRGEFGGATSTLAINTALQSQGGFATAWPEFVLATWNDTDHHVHDELSTWDPGLKHGLYEQFQSGAYFKPKRFELPSADTRTFMAEQHRAKALGPYVPPGAGIWYDVQFTDDSASYVVLDRNQLSADDKVHRLFAVMKVNNTWRDPVDLSKIDYQVYCRDRPAAQFPRDQVDEIVLIGANGGLPPPKGINTTDKDWDWFDENADPAEAERTPILVASNGGCYRWTGANSLTAEVLPGLTQSNRVVAAVTFELDDEGLQNSYQDGSAQFHIVSGGIGPAPFGTAEYSLDGHQGECTVHGGPTTKEISPEGGHLTVGLSKWTPLGPTTLGRFVELGGSDPDPPHATVRCPGSPQDTDIVMYFPLWSAIGPPTGKLGEDGHTIQGSFPLPASVYGFPVSNQASFNAIKGP